MPGQEMPPADLDALLARIAERRNLLPARLSQVAELAIRHPNDMALGTAASLATAAGVQPSTLVRFAQGFGYDGFSAMQAVFRSRLLSRAEEDEAHSIPRQGGAESAVFATAALAVGTAAGAIPAGSFAAAARLLGRAETVHLVARRRSFPLTTYLAYAFGRMRIRCQMADAGLGIEEEVLDMAGPRDAAVAISFAPYAPETLRRAQALRARGVPVVALTDGSGSPLLAAATHGFALPETHADDARALPAGMAFVVALSRAVAESRRATG